MVASKRLLIDIEMRNGKLLILEQGSGICERRGPCGRRENPPSGSFDFQAYNLALSRNSGGSMPSGSKHKRWTQQPFVEEDGKQTKIFRLPNMR
jgi:hypothetical protein